jgi:hypothetical protein
MTTLYGYPTCSCINTSAPLVERRFREAGLIVRDLSGLITQGCYSAGAVEASKGTHDGGGVLDLADFTPYRTDADVLFTACGWVDFFRPYGILYPKSPAHHHVVLNGCPHLSPGAKAQLVDAKAGLNGLAGKGKDEGPRPLVTWQQALAADGKSVPAQQEDDMALPVCMRTTDTTIWALSPGQAPRGLSMQQWLLLARLGAPLLGGDFNRAEVDIVNAIIQPAPVTASVDVAALAKTLAPLLAPLLANVDLSTLESKLTQAIDAIPQATRAAIIKEGPTS